jgi:hypothetical protein
MAENAADRPLPSVGELMSCAASTVVDRLGVFLALWAAVTLPSILLVDAALVATGLLEKDAFNLALAERRYGQLGLAAAALVIQMFLARFSGLAKMFAAKDAGAQPKPSAREALGKALTRFPAMIWTDIVVGVRVVFGFMLLIAPGVVFAIRYGLAGFVTAFEGISGGDAAARSRELVVPHMGKFLGGTIAFTLAPAAGMYALLRAEYAVLHRATALMGNSLALIYSLQIAGSSVMSLPSAWFIAAYTRLYEALAARGASTAQSR